MDWKPIDDIKTLDEIDQISKTQSIIIFKHSTRCHISAQVISNIENSYDLAGNQNFVWYYLDLLQYRNISNAIATRYGIEHESPQALVIRNGQCVYNTSHFDIRYGDLVIH